jgi:hypothetical protein
MELGSRIVLVVGAGLLLAAQTHAAGIPATQFLAVGQDMVRTECLPPTDCGFLFGDSAMSPIPVAVHLSDSGADFSQTVDATTVTGPSIVDLEAAISGGASGGGQPAAEAVVIFWIDVQPTSASAPNVPVPVDIIVRLDASADVSSASDANGSLEAEAELQSSGNLLDSVQTSCSVFAHDASCDPGGNAEATATKTVSLHEMISAGNPFEVQLFALALGGSGVVQGFSASAVPQAISIDPTFAHASDFEVVFGAHAVPEPSSEALLVTSLGSLALVIHRRARRPLDVP